MSSQATERYAAAAAKSLQSCLTLCDPMELQTPRFLRPWDFPGKSNGVGYHCLLLNMLQCSQKTNIKNTLGFFLDTNNEKSSKRKLRKQFHL